MANYTLRNGVDINENAPPYIVAEMNMSHNGNVDSAKKMIEAAKEAGCDCVKFQSWTPDSINSESVYASRPSSKRFFARLSLTEEKLYQLSKYCKTVGISFCSTPYSRSEVDFLIDQCDAPYVKIASMDINNYPFLEYIAETGVPIVMSTGMADMDEIYKAVEVVNKSGNNNLCLLHCVSIYPPQTSTIRLKNIIGLREAFPDCVVGFSDHSLGIEMASAAVALGASLVEKHLTLDKTKFGMDNEMALEPDEMAQMVRNCHSVFHALGGKERIVFEQELEQRLNMRRSIVATSALTAGTVLKRLDLDTKRPGTGLKPERIDYIVGKRVVRNIECDTLILEEDIEL